jgi:hypothetical protein
LKTRHFKLQSLEYTLLFRECEEKKYFEIPGRRWKYDIKMFLEELRNVTVGLICHVQIETISGICKHGNELSVCLTGGFFFVTELLLAAQQNSDARCLSTFGR